MLTKDDLEKIGNIIDERLDQKLDGRFDAFESKIDHKLGKRFEIFESKLDQKFDEKLEPIKKDLKSIRKKMNRMNKTLNIVAKNYDEGDVKLDRRVTRIENHLGLS